MKDGGNRVITALVYLNEPEEGGETDLVNLGLKIYPATGKLLVFHDCCKTGAQALCRWGLFLALTVPLRVSDVPRLRARQWLSDKTSGFVPRRSPSNKGREVGFQPLVSRGPNASWLCCDAIKAVRGR